MSAVRYMLDSSDTITDITATGVFSIGSAAIDSFLRLYPTDTLPCAQEGAMYYNCNAKVVKFYNGTSWINLAEAAEASGQIVMFESTCPSGWTEATDFRSKFPRGDDDGWCSAGGTGGSDTVSVTVDIASFNTTSCGDHAHCSFSWENWACPGAGTQEGSGCYYPLACASSSYSGGCVHFCTDSSGAHSHCADLPSTASTSCSNIPAYREVVFCEKD